MKEINSYNPSITLNIIKYPPTYISIFLKNLRSYHNS